MRFLLSASRRASTISLLSRDAHSRLVNRHSCQHGPFTTLTRQTARKPSRDDARPESHAHREVQRTHAIFRKLMLSRFDALIKEKSWLTKKDEYRAFGVNSRLDFEREAKLFRLSIDRACDLASESNAVSRKDNPLFWSLRNAFVTQDVAGLNIQIAYAFQNFLMRSRFTGNIRATHQKIADFRFPYEWYPATRAMQRTIHLHVGPTNSGKTYNALKALENAKSGIYAGPLRLLAHEVYSRFTAKGKPCALITGEEQRIPTDTNSFYRSCTVEMTPLNYPVDVAVIDEIQMIGDVERGWAWTQAVLGVQAKELHLCGEERTVDLIQTLCRTLGDECIVHRYQRLSGLETMAESLNGDLRCLEKGDAIVSFSRLGIHSLKRQVEQKTGKRCAVVYGSLPPETRARQAALFNDPDNDYDYLVASDAIGMGLNLEVRRIIFEATHKRDSTSYRPLTIPEMKQIGGRAGRYKTARQAMQSDSSAGTQNVNTTATINPKDGQPGLVTALEDEDLAVLIRAFKTEPEQLKTAGIQPPVNVIERMSTYFPPNTPLSFILTRLRDVGKISSNYHYCTTGEQLSIADLIQPFPMSIYDRCVFLNAPVALRDKKGCSVLQAFARCVSKMEGGDLLAIPEVELEILDVDPTQSNAADLLNKLEALHKSITLYLWLSYRFSGVFTSQRLAFHVKDLVEDRINLSLSGVTLTDEARRRRMVSQRRKVAARIADKERILGEEIEAEEGAHEVVGEWNEEGHGEPLFDDVSQLDQITRLEPKSKGARR
ncbi:P-loop containing nucleoside triphosphate hydrolase protein [Xylariaceae sp. FL1019]|nr:P-loop containing nucleoside triphosphate hydrolase protein [Xylariaceae sp. FL1019]